MVNYSGTSSLVNGTIWKPGGATSQAKDQFYKDTKIRSLKLCLTRNYADISLGSKLVKLGMPSCLIEMKTTKITQCKLPSLFKQLWDQDTALHTKTFNSHQTNLGHICMNMQASTICRNPVTFKLKRDHVRPSSLLKEVAKFVACYVQSERETGHFKARLTFVTAISILSVNVFWMSLTKHTWDSVVVKD